MPISDWGVGRQRAGANAETAAYCESQTRTFLVEGRAVLSQASFKPDIKVGWFIFRVSYADWFDCRHKQQHVYGKNMWYGWRKEKPNSVISFQNSRSLNLPTLWTWEIWYLILFPPVVLPVIIYSTLQLTLQQTGSRNTQSAKSQKKTF